MTDNTMARIALYQPNCPQCQVGDKVRRKGRYLPAGDGFYRFACTRCKVTFTRLIPELKGKCGDILDRPPRKLPNQGESHPQAKLNAQQVRDIVALYDSGSDALELAERFNISKATIVGIVTGSTWGSVTGIPSPNPRLPRPYQKRGR